jgi:hypothetical protein
VGKKPPQSQKGGSHGLTPQTSAGLSPKEKLFIYLFLFFCFFMLSCSAQTAPRSPVRSPVPSKKNRFLFFPFFSFFWLLGAYTHGRPPS